MSSEQTSTELTEKTENFDIVQSTQITNALSNLELKYSPKDYLFLLSIYNKIESKKVSLTSEITDNVKMILNRYWKKYFNPEYSIAASYDQEADIEAREKAIIAYQKLLKIEFIKTKKISYAKVCYNLGYCYSIDGHYQDAINYLKIAVEKYSGKNKTITQELLTKVEKWQQDPLSVYDDEDEDQDAEKIEKSANVASTNSPSSSSSSSTSTTTTTPSPVTQHNAMEIEYTETTKTNDNIKSQQAKILQLENNPNKSPEEKTKLAKLCLKVGIKFAQAGNAAECNTYTKKLNQHYADACQTQGEFNSTPKPRQ